MATAWGLGPRTGEKATIDEIPADFLELPDGGIVAQALLYELRAIGQDPHRMQGFARDPVAERAVAYPEVVEGRSR